MRQAISIFVLLGAIFAVVFISAGAPRWINDQNSFLKTFISQDLLSILGVILAITLASASQIHLKFNDLEERMGHAFLANSRKEVKDASYWLLFSFFIAVFLVIIKPLFVAHNFGVAFINGIGLWILLLNIVILFDITAGIFTIGPLFLSKSESADQPTAPPPIPEPPEKT